jgi:Family of unknown function (DUF6057)
MRVMEFQRPSAGRLLDLAFVAGVLVYAYSGIDTRLIFHWQAPAFYMTTEFAGEFLKYPGGPVDYLYSLIAQAYAFQIWGALILTAQIAAAGALTEVCFGARPLLRFFPAVFLLYSLNLYYDHTPLAAALLLALAAAIPVVRSTAAPMWMLITLLLAVYYLGGMALVFFVLAAAGTLIARRQYAKGIASLLLAAAVPLIVERLGLLHVPLSARDWFIDTDFRRLAIWWSLYLFCALASFVCGRLSASEPTANPATGGRPAWRHWPTVLAPIAVLACLAAVAVFSYRTNARDRRLAAVDYHTSRENWPEVIAASNGLIAADFNSLTRYEVNLALHEMNRLGDEMFRFPQTGSALPGLRVEVFLPYMIRVTDLFLRLGRINDAERFGNEALIVGQSDRRLLRLMAELNMVKGQTGAARKFLTILSDEVGSAVWARRRLRELNDDPQLAADESVQLLRRRMLRADDVIPVWQNPDKPDADVNRLLLDQLERDPSNRMAFEFLMGNYLLARDLPAARGLMPRIRYMSGAAYEGPDGKRRTPRHYQEAMAMYGDANGKPVELEGLEIEPETLNRMAVFKRLMSQSTGRDAAMQAAWGGFRGSYFFYFVFGPGDYR